MNWFILLLLIYFHLKWKLHRNCHVVQLVDFQQVSKCFLRLKIIFRLIKFWLKLLRICLIYIPITRGIYQLIFSKQNFVVIVTFIHFLLFEMLKLVCLKYWTNCICTGNKLECLIEAFDSKYMRQSLSDLICLRLDYN